jgi:cytochrome c553
MKSSKSTLLAGTACLLFPFWTLAQPPAGDGTPAHLRSCAACHGVNGVSTEPGTPHIAAQRSTYLAAQLRAYRSGARENALMNAVSASLTDAEIDALAAYYATRPGPTDGTDSSPMLDELVLTEFPFPADYESAFLRYRTTYPGNQVRHLYANDVAVNAARAGESLPDGSYLIVEIFARQQDANGNAVLGSDGQPVAGERTGFNVMAREAGWGDRVPALLRNENWLYANLDARGNVNTGANQAACLACHVPLTEDSFLFTIEQLAEAARAAD